MRNTFEIFLSSTSQDLQDCRDAVRSMIGRMRETTIAMETFGARPNKPLETCRQEVAASDAMVVIVGHRYGWIPTVAQGGDGRRSITWWEVTWALDAGKPVYAFLIDPKARWEGEREQDRLISATTDEMAVEIGNAVHGLVSFRAFLDNHTTREFFNSPEDLSGKVASSLHLWLLKRAVDAARANFPVKHENALAARPEPLSPGQLAGTADQIYWQEQVHLFSARSLGKDASNVRVALVAGEANTAHPGLAASSITQLDIRRKATQDPPDDYTTGLAGLLVGSDEAGPQRYRGLVPQAHLLVLRVLTQQGAASSSDLLAALNAAIREGAHVICMPLGGLISSRVDQIAYSRVASMGVTVVCAAGNGAAPLIYPAAYNDCISVGTTDRLDGIAHYSDHGDWITTFAPGADIPVPEGTSGYVKRAGTSYACAITAGAVAMMLAANPKLSPGHLRDILRSQSRILNVSNAIERATAGRGRARSPKPPSRPPRTTGGSQRGRRKVASATQRSGRMKK